MKMNTVRAYAHGPWADIEDDDLMQRRRTSWPALLRVASA
jgi:hypothetical protein